SQDIKPSPSSTIAPAPSTSATSAGAKSTNKKIFGTEELVRALLSVWEKLYNTEESLPFQDPVDPIKLQIPDYYDIIKNPMDLSTIKEKLMNGIYKDHWEFCNDVWLMFDNAWLYNRKSSRVYKYCTRLSEIFMEEIDPVMRQAGYCCGRKLAFTPLALVCYGQTMCSIPRDAYYYCYEIKSQFSVGLERYTYCKKCFEELPGESINLSEDSTSNNLVHKTQFQYLKNDHIEHEPFVNCVDCGRQWHQICALHLDQIWSTGFVCDTCLKSKTKKRPENRYTAKRLPHCKLSQHLENRVNSVLRKNVGCHGAEVIIRVLASSDKEVEVKPYVKARFCSTGEMCEKFPYRAKAIFAFEVIDGTEVCFFGLHVQEYSDKAVQPNSRRVYIAYLDSVHFFTPKLQRTRVYHEILLGYLEYCKNLGYTMAHIWACPPSEGDDYIFHCHPIEQKIPKPKRLQDWYKKMLEQGIVERLVLDYKDIHKQAQDDNLQSPAELPYFEGDYWPNVLEDCVKEMESEEAERRREIEIQAAAANNDSNNEECDDEAEEFPVASGKKRSAKGPKKNTKNKKSGQYKKSKKSGGAGVSGNQLTDKIMAAMEKHKEVFFVVRLHSAHSAASLGAVVDPDQLISCELMDGRDNFLSTARERHWEFSSLRRAKWSTLALCYELHTQGQDKFTYSCNSCKNGDARWHCTTCEDFDLCQSCYAQTKHPHKMEQQRSLLQDEGGEQASQNTRSENLQRCIQSLVHSCQCRDANCRRLTCHKMKRVVQHTRQCKRRQNGPCLVCKQLIALCCYHAKHCQEQQCPVPFCPNIRQKLAEQAAQLKKKRDREMIRRIQLMGGANNGPSSNAPQPSPSMSQVAQQQAVSGQPVMASSLASLYNQQSPCPAPASTSMNMQAPQPSQQIQIMGGGGSGPLNVTIGPSPGGFPTSLSTMPPQTPQAALRAAKEVERMAAVQHSSAVRFMSPNQGPMMMARQSNPMMSGVGRPMMTPGPGSASNFVGQPVMAPSGGWDGGLQTSQTNPMMQPPGMMQQQQGPSQVQSQHYSAMRMSQIRVPPPNVAVGPGMNVISNQNPLQQHQPKDINLQEVSV
uniref:histone acetyltransferase n=1 Tax=Romanomermis culicivorax TaxID=13658 RepID=A0A915L5B2_ROMCU